MINRNKKISISLTLISVILSVVLQGCGQQSSPPEPQGKQQSAQMEDKAEKAPEELKGLEQNIESIITELDGGTASALQKPEEGQQGGQQGGQQSGGQQQGGQAQGGQQGGGQPQGGQQQGGQQQGGQAQGGQQGEPPVTLKNEQWDKILSTAHSMNYQWNSFMPGAVKSGADKALVDRFSNALNTLTTTITTKNKNNTLISANNLYALIPDFYSLYSAEGSPEIKRIKFLTRSAMFNAMTGNWKQADTDMNTLKSTYGMFKTGIPKEQVDTANKLDFAITELDKVAKQQSLTLTEIKGRIAIVNIGALEKAMSEGK